MCDKLTTGEFDTASLLSNLTQARIVELGRTLGIAVPATAKKNRQIEVLVESAPRDWVDLLGRFYRDELKAACRHFGLDDTGRARKILEGRLLRARGEDGAASQPAFLGRRERRDVPRRGDVVRVRRRQYLVDGVKDPAKNGGSVHVVDLTGLDDDNQGRRLRIVWEVEPGARVVKLETEGLGSVEAFDSPGRFGAYLAALRWHGVTATDARLFQAPFRAGIRLKNYQLVPLQRALELPRANLFVADDVGLGKTIEAGLVLQELRIRQRVDFVLVACPASICLQWRDEMWRRFGLHFEVMNREFVARRRRERGFAINPWETHSRFVVSHSILRRPEYRDRLLEHLGDRAKKSLLVLDEAHAAAPSSAQRYAVDTQLTKVVRDLAPRFENRLFLSATPHNGHSNSFSALLELLDQQRFTRGVQVSERQRDRVMVRRLKSDLKALGDDSLPRRHVVRNELHWGDGWRLRRTDSVDAETSTDDRVEDVEEIGGSRPFELELARLLDRYQKTLRVRHRAGKLGLIRLQYRLLSSVAAFDRTLRLHATRQKEAGKSSGASRTEEAAQLYLSSLDLAASEDDLQADDPNGLDEVEAEELEESRYADSARFLDAGQGAREILQRMLDVSSAHRDAPCAKVRAVLRWIRRNQCRGVEVGGAARTAGRPPKLEDLEWTRIRLIIFTEFVDTAKYLQRILATACRGTDGAQDRIALFQGGLGDAAREDLQRRWNGDPDIYPVRILIATDAAREGVNLQGACADLFHFDVPWNPARLEQRNGRIDRTLQPASDVFCRYFVYPERPEDRVLETLVRKVEVIQREAGSVGTVILDQIEKVMSSGIDSETEARLEATEGASGRRDMVDRQLESSRDRKRLQGQIDQAGKLLDASRDSAGFEPDLLRAVVDEALALLGLGQLERATPNGNGPEEGVWRLPELPATWQSTEDTLRPARERDEPLWEWRQRPPLPVVFEPPATLADDRVQLHLEHPLVQRLLSRFLSQGFRHDDLSRATVLRDAGSSLTHAVLFGRLSLFGPGATRLHDQLVAVAAPVHAAGSDGPVSGHLEPLPQREEEKLVDRLWRRLRERPALDEVPGPARRRLSRQVPEVSRALWPHLEEEAESLAHEAEEKLRARGAHEAEELRALLEDQRSAVERELEARQMTFDFDPKEAEQLRQWEADRDYMAERLGDIDREIATEPEELEQLYQVDLRRLEPVGMVFLWPETR